jgi:hypothetical protein
MIETFTSENSGDFQARYAETFGWLHRTDRKQFINLESVIEDKVSFSIGTHHKYSVNINSGINFEFIPVDRGWFNTTNGEVVYLQRRPARQWKRGISESNTEIYDAYRSRVDLTFARLSSIFENPNKWGIKPSQCAISKQFAMLPDGTVYFYLHCVGRWVDNTIILDNSIVEQELRDQLTRQQSTIEVKV